MIHLLILHAAVSHLQQTLCRNRIAHQIPALFIMRPQEEMIIRNVPGNPQRQFPQMILPMVHTDRQNRSTPLDKVHGSDQRRRFRSLNVHFQEGYFVTIQYRVERRASDFDSPGSKGGTGGARRVKSDNFLAASRGQFQQCYLTRQFIGQ